MRYVLHKDHCDFFRDTKMMGGNIGARKTSRDAVDLALNIL